MKKCINISEGLYVNLDQVVSFDIEKTQGYESNEPQVVISTSSHPASEYGWFTVALVDEDEDELAYKMQRDGKVIYVKIQEFNRIIRELCEFFDVKAPTFEK